MPKNTTRSRSARTQVGRGVRGRDAGFPSAPVRVSDDAQAKVIDFNTARQFEFSRLERNKLPERPSTSGGPAANLPARRNAEKRETKDDLHLNPLTAAEIATTFYNFPLPGPLPTPNSTSRSSPPLRISSLPRSYTPNPMELGSANLAVPPTQIGMALGSPTHQPATFHSHPPFETARNASPDPVDSSVDTGAYVPASSKQKTSKWKMFGGLFGGKKQTGGSPQAFYQVQPEGTASKTTVESDHVHSREQSNSSEQKKHRGRGRTNSQRNPDKHKPDLKRANTAPLNFALAGGQTATPEIKLDGGPLMPQSGQGQRHQGGPLLNVDIPSIEMERYSIMFGSLLQKPTGTSSSLLARRQATLNSLKTVNEALAEKERELEERSKRLRPRRATSPQPTKSPAFSLFPNTPSKLTVRDGSPSPNRLIPLHRSNTSPAALSPSRPSFAPGPQNETHATLMAPGPHVPMIPRSRDENPRKGKREPKLSVQKFDNPSNPDQNRNWSSEESHLMLDSPSSDVAEEEDVYDPAPFIMKPKLEEPTWQMIAPSGSGSNTSSSDHSTSTSASSISTTSIAPFTSANLKTVKIQPPPPKFRSRSGTAPSSTTTHRNPSETPTLSSATSSQQRPEISKAPPTAKISQNSEVLSVSSIPRVKKSTGAEVDDEHEARLKTAADVSIARQISVSRQQRQLLIPIRATSKANVKPKHNQNFPSPLNMNRGASPLAAVMAESPASGSSSGRKGSVNGAIHERLVAATVKPSTPTLVVVGDGNGEKWSGRAVENSVSGGSGEIRVGLAVGLEVQGHQHRKSERVVVERISVVSN